MVDIDHVCETGSSPLGTGVPIVRLGGGRTLQACGREVV